MIIIVQYWIFRYAEITNRQFSTYFYGLRDSWLVEIGMNHLKGKIFRCGQPEHLSIIAKNNFCQHNSHFWVNSQQFCKLIKRIINNKIVPIINVATIWFAPLGATNFPLLRDRKKSFRNFFFNFAPNGIAFSRPSRIVCALVRREIRTGTRFSELISILVYI